MQPRAVDVGDVHVVEDVLQRFPDKARVRAVREEVVRHRRVAGGGRQVQRRRRFLIPEVARQAGIEEDDLPTLHDLVVAELVEVIGVGTDLESVFRFISSKEGEKTMAEAKLNQTHKDLLQYFSSMILDPDGHKRWMEEIRDDLKN